MPKPRALAHNVAEWNAGHAKDDQFSGIKSMQSAYSRVKRRLIKVATFSL